MLVLPDGRASNTDVIIDDDNTTKDRRRGCDSTKTRVLLSVTMKHRHRVAYVLENGPPEPAQVYR